MSEYAKKEPPEYLREARLRAGYTTRGTAATVVPYSQETIGRHERGEVEVAPEDAVMYAQCYGERSIMFHYCARCPVGKSIGRKAKSRSLPLATLRLRHLVSNSQAVANRLEEIAFDGVIDSTEIDDFEKALAFLRSLEDSIEDIILVSVEQRKCAHPVTAKTEQALMPMTRK